MSASVVILLVLEALALMVAAIAGVVSNNLRDSISWYRPEEYNANLKTYQERAEFILNVAAAYLTWGVVAIVVAIADALMGYIILSLVVLVAAIIVYQSVQYITEELRTKARGEEE